ncbi:calcium/sodium antiporter [Lachnospiraceae bacterium CLA-AA-H215]|uniref:Calcium/sodium antiporter n=1 Tax=Hominifimenecus microfluidus TaxID=2885348 RepID=A0AAE3E924_9FIRM|nr:calcium/sodium antiporter [Hominifimenecus microfluidus]MCC2229610.1 calcium/sodium antiporter [Hominifimenecus microfluidus]
MVIQVLILIAGFLLLVKGADWFVDGAASLAERMGIPQLVVGLTIVAMGTSMPEAAVSIASALKNNPEIAIGNVVGSNTLNILLILGLTALIHPIRIQRSTIRYEMPFMIAVTLLLTAFGISGSRISRTEGVIFWGLFILYFVYLFWLSRNHRKQGTEDLKDSAASGITAASVSAEESVETKGGKQQKHSILWYLAEILIGGAMVVWGSDLVVDSATVLAGMFGMSDRMIALTIVAFGTSLPELVTSVTAARKGNADLAVGNVVGSNIFNILMIIGTVALIRPIPFADAFYLDLGTAIISAVVLWFGSIPSQRLGRAMGACLLLLYAGYFVILCR